MREFPQHGERYCNQQSRTVRILSLYRADEATARNNPEFSYEVVFEYDLSGNMISMPLPWFSEVYSKIADAPRSLAPRPPAAPVFKGGLQPPARDATADAGARRHPLFPLPVTRFITLHFRF